MNNQINAVNFSLDIQLQKFIYKIVNKTAPPYLCNHIPDQPTPNVSLRRTSIRSSISRTNRHDNSFFPFCIENWNNLDSDLKTVPSLSEFKSKITKLIRPKGNTFYKICDTYGIKLLTKIRVKFSDLRDHRYNDNFEFNDFGSKFG